MKQISKKSVRLSLTPRRDPYWQQLDKGQFIGFRRGSDTWIARFRDTAGKQHFNSLGQFEEYSDAKDKAEAWFAQMAGAGSVVKRGTVKDALDSYLAQLRTNGREKAALTADKKFTTMIYSDSIAQMRLEDCAKGDFQKWRQRVQARAGGLANQTVNRYVGQVVAAMNCAISECGFTGNALAWTMMDLPEAGADEGDNAVFVTADHRERMEKFAPAELADFLSAIYRTGGRPTELREATVGDYSASANTLVLRHMKGRPAKLRARVVTLDMKDASFFKRLVKGRAANEPLCQTAGGVFWTSDRCAKEFRPAVAAANYKAPKDEVIPKDASAYSYRHARISEMLQVMGIDPLTVAAQTGTSLAMIEKYYFKFIPSSIREKFAKAA